MLGRLIVLLLIALALGLYFPQSRAVMLETASPLANPAFGWMTRQELSQVSEDLESFMEDRRYRPLRMGEFDTWLDDRYPQEASRLDAWNTRYRATVTGSTYLVISAGPDHEFGTQDDITQGPPPPIN